MLDRLEAFFPLHQLHLASLLAQENIIVAVIIGMGCDGAIVVAGHGRVTRRYAIGFTIVNRYSKHGVSHFLSPSRPVTRESEKRCRVGSRASAADATAQQRTRDRPRFRPD